MKKLLISFIFLFTLSGCAAMFHGTSQQVSIRSQNPSAKIYVNEAYLGNGNVITAFKCSGQLKLATFLAFTQYRRSDSLGVRPPLYQCGL
ncbi:hypothetical protein FLL89_07220, partial [Vibrio cholerae]